MSQYFPHEQLDVYGVALRFIGIADDLLCAWPCSWAVHSQFDRAGESIITNLAQAARLRATDAGIYVLRVKSTLREVMAMLSGLHAYLEK